jgi:Lar family restriction alleviation protein
MSDELKPCPFCGGEARAFYSEESGTFDVQCQRCGAIPFIGSRTSERKTMADVIAAWNARAERTCRFSLEEDREMLAEKAACGPGEFVTQDMPDLLWTCSTCGEQYRNGLDALPGWLKHCPNCGAKVTDEEEVG